MNTYTTQAGDTWDWISKKNYGSEYYVDKLIDVNPKHVDVAIFSAGIVINVPEIDTATQNKTNIRPWER